MKKMVNIYDAVPQRLRIGDIIVDEIGSVNRGTVIRLAPLTIRRTDNQRVIQCDGWEDIHVVGRVYIR